MSATPSALRGKKRRRVGGIISTPLPLGFPGRVIVAKPGDLTRRRSIKCPRGWSPRLDPAGARGVAMRGSRLQVNHSSANFSSRSPMGRYMHIAHPPGVPHPNPTPGLQGFGRDKHTARTLGAPGWGSGPQDGASETGKAPSVPGRTAPMAPRCARPVGSRHNVSLSTIVLAPLPIVGHPAT